MRVAEAHYDLFAGKQNSNWEDKIFFWALAFLLIGHDVTTIEEFQMQIPYLPKLWNYNKKKKENFF